MKDWGKEHTFRDLFFSLPEMKENEFIKHLYQANKEEEDEGERASSLAMIFDDGGKGMPMSDERTAISLVNMPRTLRFIVRRDNDE